MPRGDSWRAWSEEAIHVKIKEPGSGQEQLGGIMRVKSATRNCPTEKTSISTTSKQDQRVKKRRGLITRHDVICGLCVRVWLCAVVL